jgi:hypothetical protein
MKCVYQVYLTQWPLSNIFVYCQVVYSLQNAILTKAEYFKKNSFHTFSGPSHKCHSHPTNSFSMMLFLTVGN